MLLFFVNGPADPKTMENHPNNMMFLHGGIPLPLAFDCDRMGKEMWLQAIEVGIGGFRCAAHADIRFIYVRH